MLDRLTILGFHDVPRARSRKAAGRRPEAHHVVASDRRKKFHRPECEWAACIGHSNLLEFHDREEAIAAGYKPCGTCCA